MGPSNLHVNKSAIKMNCFYEISCWYFNKIILMTLMTIKYLFFCNHYWTPTHVIKQWQKKVLLHWRQRYKIRLAGNDVAWLFIGKTIKPTCKFKSNNIRNLSTIIARSKTQLCNILKRGNKIYYKTFTTVKNTCINWQYLHWLCIGVKNIKQ